MTIHEYGKENEKVVILIHPSVVMWDYFSYVVPLMEAEYHLVIPALPGYDPDKKNDFTSIDIKKNFPQTKFRQLKNVGHGGLASLQPERLAKGIKSICG